MRVDGVLNGGQDIPGDAGDARNDGRSAREPDAGVSAAVQGGDRFVARDFFGSPASGGWGMPVLLPDARVASAELFVTNSRGDSPTAVIAVTQTIDAGLRTLSGGQYSIEVQGYLAIENGAAPDLLIEATHTVQDIYAVVRLKATESPVVIRLNQDGVLYCTVTIPADTLFSDPVDGFLLPR